MKLTQILFHPFHRIAGVQALGLGLVTVIVAGLLGAGQGLHCDGVLDLHVGRSAPWWLFVTEGLIDWLCLALVLLAAGRLVSRSAFRSIDLIGTQALARWPMLGVALACLTPGFHRFNEELLKALTGLKPGEIPSLPTDSPDVFVFACVTLVMLLGTVWMVALMWKSFSLCCNVRGGRAVTAFVLGLLAAEVLSKLLVGRLFLLA